jgi:hypothetical protein
LYFVNVNTCKYHVSYTDGKISVRIHLFLLPIFPPSPHSIVVFLSCRPFVVITTFSTGLVGRCECCGYNERPTGKENTIEWDDGGRIGNKNTFLDLFQVFVCPSSLLGMPGRESGGGNGCVITHIPHPHTLSHSLTKCSLFQLDLCKTEIRASFLLS